MSIKLAFASVTASATNGAQTIRNSVNVAEVNRSALGVYHVHLTDSIPNLSSVPRCAVKATLNAGDATRRFVVYEVVSERQITVRIMDNAGTAGLDIDFSVYVEADADTSPGA